MEKATKAKASSRNNSPSPASYKSFEAWSHQNTNVSNHKNSIKYKIGKNAKKTYVDFIKIKAKTTPGVGKYEAHT